MTTGAQSRGKARLHVIVRPAFASALGLACVTRSNEVPPERPAASSSEQPRTEPNPPLVTGDMDADGIPDDIDQCPLEPESWQGIDDEDGCPDIPGAKLAVDCDRVVRLVSLRDVHFGLGDHLLDDDEDGVAGLLAYMRDFPDVVVDIAGHSDSHESPRDKQRLSELRAESVRSYLISRGVDPGRIRTIGFGDRFPVDAGRSAEGRASNRRVEVHGILEPMCPDLADGGASARLHELDAGE